jgi:putative PIN family toxin of toxin-antitoxin system
VRIALDSAILVRAHHKATGSGRALVVELLDHGHDLVLSRSILDEVQMVLHYPRLVKRFGLSEEDILQFVAFLSDWGIVVVPDEKIVPPIRDPKDVHVIQTAISGQSEYLCTLDEHFHEEPVVAFCAEHGTVIIRDPELLWLIREL